MGGLCEKEKTGKYENVVGDVFEIQERVGAIQNEIRLLRASKNLHVQNFPDEPFIHERRLALMEEQLVSTTRAMNTIEESHAKAEEFALTIRVARIMRRATADTQRLLQASGLKAKQEDDTKVDAPRPVPGRVDSTSVGEEPAQTARLADERASEVVEENVGEVGVVAMIAT